MRRVGLGGIKVCRLSSIYFGWLLMEVVFVNLFWPFFFHGCNLTRPTDEMILRVGGWEHVEMKKPDGQNRYMPCPGMLGVFIKKSA